VLHGEIVVIVMMIVAFICIIIFVVVVVFLFEHDTCVLLMRDNDSSISPIVIFYMSGALDVSFSLLCYLSFFVSIKKIQKQKTKKQKTNIYGTIYIYIYIGGRCCQKN
jgi:amino acid transporter